MNDVLALAIAIVSGMAVAFHAGQVAAANRALAEKIAFRRRIREEIRSDSFVQCDQLPSGWHCYCEDGHDGPHIVWKDDAEDGDA